MEHARAEFVVSGRRIRGDREACERSKALVMAGRKRKRSVRADVHEGDGIDTGYFHPKLKLDRLLDGGRVAQTQVGCHHSLSAGVVWLCHLEGKHRFRVVYLCDEKVVLIS